MVDNTILIGIVLEMLKRHEGTRLKPYRDTVGKLTIGIGRNLDDVGVSREEADYLCRNDINIAIKHAMNYTWFNDLSLNRQTVIVNMMLNLGPAGFATFKNFIMCIEEYCFITASEEMLKSKWAEQVKGRAKELSTMMKEG